MKKILISILIIGIFYVLRYAFMIENIKAESTVLTGLVLITAYLFAVSLKNLKLPKLTGYMLLGAIIGPIGLNLLDKEILERLSFLEHMALSFIALTAGGELKYERIKKFKKSIIYLLTGQIIVVFIGMLIAFVMVAGYLPFFTDESSRLVFGLAILFAGTALSTSPAVTIGIITEFKSQGKATDIILSVTVLKSILLVFLFPVLLTWAKLYLVEGTSFSISVILDLFLQISGSIFVGSLIGGIIIWYLRYIQVERTLFLMGVAIIVTEISLMFNLEILLTSIMAGIVVENFSKQGEPLIHGIEKSSLPLYIIFFCFAGAGLHLETLQKALFLTIFLVSSRMIFTYLGNYFGSILAKENLLIKRYSWMGFVGQAGIALGLGTIIVKTIPGPIGIQFKTILIASVVINEFIGPIFFRYALIKLDEVHT